MDKKRSIRQKMITVILSLSLISLFLMSMVVVFSMTNMRNSINSTSGALGQSAADDSQSALEKQAVAQLTATAQNKARISDEKLTKLQKYVQLMSMQATEIYSNPSRYVPAGVKPPSSSNKGKITPQLLYAEGSDKAALAGEVALAANIDNILATIPENDVDVFSTYIGTESGFVIKVDKDSDDKLQTLDPRQRGWYKLARENNSLVWTDVFDDAMGRGLAITCAQPFYDARGNIKGVVGIGSLLTTLNEIIIEAKIGETGYALVLNEKGDMIISPTVQRVEGKIVRENFLTSDNASLKAVAQKMVDRQSGVERFVYNGKEVLLAYQPLQNLPWSIAAVMEVNEAIAPALQSKTNIITLASKAVEKVDRDILTVIILFVVVSIASVLLVVFFSLVLSRRITNPLADLTERVAKVSAGDFDLAVDVKTGDEIEELANSFNNMTVELKKYMANLAAETAARERISSELEVAAQIQNDMVPNIFPAFPDRPEFDIYAEMHTAKEVGGDFYDFFLIDENHLAFVMADVSGKGIPAALFMMIAKTIIKNNLLAGLPVDEALYRSNNSLCENNESNMFVTAFIAVLDIPNGLVSYANAGHNPPLLQRAGQDYEWLPVKRALVLAGMEDTSFFAQEIQLNKGDRLFCYTDGVTEAMNEAQELYSDQRLLAVLNTMKHLPGNIDLLAGIKKDVEAFAGEAEQADDITMLVVELKIAVEASE